MSKLRPRLFVLPVLALVLALGIACGGDSGGEAGNDFPDDVQENFMASCTENSTRSACQCALDALEEEYSLDEFSEMEETVLSTGQIPPRVAAIILGCTGR